MLTGVLNRKFPYGITSLNSSCSISLCFILSLRSQLPRHKNKRSVLGRWYVLVRPGWRKPFKRVPSLLWHDVIQWRMDHVLHNSWIRQTQDWSQVQCHISIWNWRVQDELQQHRSKLINFFEWFYWVTDGKTGKGCGKQFWVLGSVLKMTVIISLANKTSNSKNPITILVHHSFFQPLFRCCFSF